ncbi:chromosomal replication initiator protein DnaA [Lachnospiraceae bacterium C1.1]|nr:chromosomal replication initiator protein DnaA [Lachnospiraceae bacterium C1.1]
MDEKQSLIENWNKIKEVVRTENGILDVPFETWIAPMEIFSVEGNTLKIITPGENQRGVEVLTNKYKLVFEIAISEVMNKRYTVVFITEEEAKNSSAAVEKVNTENLKLESDNIQRSNLNPKYTFDTFVVGPNNRLAHSAALAVAEDPGIVYNPLFLYGGPGLGKTHLMHSIGHYIIRKNPNKNIRYVTSETFTNEVIETIQLGGTQGMSKFREKYRTVDVLLLDDVQFIIGKESTQNEFFNTFNELHAQNKAIILSSDKPPKDMETLEERLRSRFDWGLTVDINPPDYETRMAILRRYAKTIGVSVDDEIVQFVASNIKSNIRELEGALNKIVALHKLDNREITMYTAEQAIKDMIMPDTPRKVTPEIIIAEVAKYYNTTAEDINSSRRNKEIVVPRQVAMYLCREKTDTALAEIGKIMGNRDHTTVIHGHDKIEQSLSTDLKLKNEIEEIMKIIFPA